MALKKFLLLPVFIAFSVLLFAQNSKQLYKKKVYFDFNKWDVRSQDKKVLALMVRAIKAQTTPYYIIVTGHTDNIDNNNYNYKLGLKRAKSVAQYLIKMGVSKAKMKLFSKGEEQKVAANTSDSLRLLNRRVEIILYRGNTNTNLVSVDSTIQITFKSRMIDSITGKPLTGQMFLFRVTDTGYNVLVNRFVNTSVLSASIIKGKYEIAYSSKGYRAKNKVYDFSGDEFVEGKEVRAEEKLRKLKIKRKVSFDKIHFYGNEARFLPSSGPHLRQILRLAKSKKVAAIEIVGHVNYPYYYEQNDENKIKSNFELSFNRAKAVYNYLVQNGINGAIITYKGVSNTEMKYPNAVNEQEMQKNRRVEVLVLEESVN